SLFCGMIPTASAASLTAEVKDDSGKTIATVVYDEPGSLETNLTVRIFLDGLLVGKTQPLGTSRTSNHVEVTPTEPSWNYDRYTFSEGSGSWGKLGTLTAYAKNVTLDVYYT